jgi:PHD/YefM family antitoxin component YafN of YafNO toxin-antitoxin module
MPAQKEKYVVDSKGRPVSVIVAVREYRQMLRDLEELESIKAYDRAKASGDEAVTFDQAFEEIERSRR